MLSLTFSPFCNYQFVIANVDFKDILSYSSKLAKYTSAPPGFDLASADVKVFEKPYPDEEQMRRGLIYRQHGGAQHPSQEDQCKLSFLIMLLKNVNVIKTTFFFGILMLCFCFLKCS